MSYRTHTPNKKGCLLASMLPSKTFQIYATLSLQNKQTHTQTNNNTNIMCSSHYGRKKSLLKGSLGNQKWFFYGSSLQKHPLGTFIFKSVQNLHSHVF